jgi:hypothetical protein
LFDFSRYFETVLRMNHRSSAMSPLLWINALITVPCYTSSFFFLADSFRWAPFTIGTVIVIYTLWKYECLVKLNPRWVQSEKYQIESQKIDLIAQKGGKIIIDPVNIQFTEEPKRLSNPRSQASDVVEEQQ